MEPYIKKVDFLDLFNPKGMYKHIRFFSIISLGFFIGSMTFLRSIMPVKYIAFILVYNKKVVGNAYLTQKGRRAELAIAVDKEFRKKDYGSKLIKRLLEETNSNIEVFLRVKNDNAIAQKFFKKHGFVEDYSEMIWRRKKK